MANINYAAWNIAINSFPQNGSMDEKIKFLLNFGILAPSGHNSQPWKCGVSGNVLKINYARERSLAESDPEGRMLFIGLGCFVENILIAADYFGMKSVLSHEKNGSDSYALSMTFTQAIPFHTEKYLLNAIVKRVSNRYKYQDRSIPVPIIENLNKLSSNTSQVQIVMEKSEKDALAQIMEKAQIEAMDSQAFRNELSYYLKSSFTKDPFGMPGFTLDMPAAFSIIAPKLVKKVNLSKLTAKKDLNLLLKHTPALGVISVTENNKINWLETGRIFEKLWLLATQQDLACSVWAAAVQLRDYSEQIRKLLKITTYPAVLFRIGYPKKTPGHSPRFPLKDILK
jgi:nitroreductase